MLGIRLFDKRQHGITSANAAALFVLLFIQPVAFLHPHLDRLFNGSGACVVADAVMNLDDFHIELVSFEHVIPLFSPTTSIETERLF